MLVHTPAEVIDVIERGGVIAYPTEAVYGLGCDPDNDDAIEKLLRLKQRPWEKGLILVAGHFTQLLPYVDESRLTDEQLDYAFSKWPGPYTFIMPIKPGISKLLCGSFNSIAVRVSDHEGIQEICNALGKPLVSTSANITGQPPAMCGNDVSEQFANNIDALVTGSLGAECKPSTIIDAVTGKILR